MKVNVDGFKRTAVEFVGWGNKYTGIFQKTTYLNHNLAIQVLAYDKEFGCYMPYCTLTVNLVDELKPNQAYIDTNNCPATLIDQMEAEGYMKSTGRMYPSGYFIYPLYEFSEEFLTQLDKEMEGGPVYAQTDW